MNFIPFFSYLTSLSKLTSPSTDARAEIVTPFCSELLRLCASFGVGKVLLWKVLFQEALEVGVQHDAFSPVEGSRYTHFQLSLNKIGKMPKGKLTWYMKIISINLRKSKHLTNILFRSTSWETIYLLWGPVRFLPDLNLIFCYLDRPDNLLFTSMFLVSPQC